MSLTKYLQTIKTIDPGKIYVENVRSMLGTSRFNARLYCEMAVRDEVFDKRTGLVCPYDNRIIEDFDFNGQLPFQITCHICEIEEREQSTFNTDELEKIEFYQLRK